GDGPDRLPRRPDQAAPEPPGGDQRPVPRTGDHPAAAEAVRSEGGRMTTASTIEVEHLVKRYARAPRNAVDDVSFTVERGETFGLLGPNGAGKTTVINVLTTRAVPSAGRAAVAGVDVAADPMGARQRIGVVPQSPNLDRSLRVA